MKIKKGDRGRQVIAGKNKGVHGHGHRRRPPGTGCSSRA